jgi:hypothetical protein
MAIRRDSELTAVVHFRGSAGADAGIRSRHMACGTTYVRRCSSVRCGLAPLDLSELTWQLSTATLPEAERHPSRRSRATTGQG